MTLIFRGGNNNWSLIPNKKHSFTELPLLYGYGESGLQTVRWSWQCKSKDMHTLWGCFRKWGNTETISLSCTFIFLPLFSPFQKVCWVCHGSGNNHGDERNCHHCNGRGREKWICRYALFCKFAIAAWHVSYIWAHSKAFQKSWTVKVGRSFIVFQLHPMSWPGIDRMLNVSWTTPAVGQHQPDCEMVLYCFIACNLYDCFIQSVFCSVNMGLRLLIPIWNVLLRTNNSSDYIVEQSSGLLLENLNQVTGKELFKDAQYLVR